MLPRSILGPDGLGVLARDGVVRAGLVLAAAILLVLTWSSPVHETWPFALAFLVAFGVLALLEIRDRPDDPVTVIPAAGGVGMGAAAFVVLALSGGVTVFWDRVWVEVLLSILVAGTGTAFALVLHRVMERNASPTFAGPAAVAVLFWAGAVARWIEMSTVLPQGDVEVLHLVIRHDVGQLLWLIGATVAALHTVYALVTEQLVQLTPALKRVVAVLAVLMTLAAHVGGAVATVGTVTAQGRPDLGVGVHARDVDNVPEGVDDVHIEVWWGHVLPYGGAWNWTYYDEQMRKAEERDQDVFLLIGLAPPDWVVEAFPNSTMVDQDGEPFHKVDSDPDEPADRIHDISYTHPEINAMREDFLRKAVERYGDAPPVTAVAVMNEPAYPVDFNLFRIGSYDNATVDAFRDRMRAEHANISAMNAEMGTSFASFEEVRPPDSLDGRYGEAWQRFRGDTIVDLSSRLISAARDHTDNPVTVKIMGHYLTRYATPQTALTDRVVRQLAGMSDIVAVDLYPVSQADLEQTLEYYAALAGDKPLWITEFNFAMGPNLPTMGVRTYETLAMIGRHADQVFFFTAEDHYLYGVSQYGSSPNLEAIRLYQTPVMSAEFPAQHAELLVAELAAVANIYHVYATVSAFAGLPVVPWPVLLLLGVPLPRLERLGERKMTAGRTLAAGGLWVVIWLPGAMGVV